MLAGELAVAVLIHPRRVLRNAQDLVVLSTLDRHGFRSLGFRVAGSRVVNLRSASVAERGRDPLLHDSHARRSEHLVAPTIAALHFLGDCARFKFLALHQADGVVQFGVEDFAEGQHRSHSLRLQ